ncbi:MAG: diacylglycerol/lipid kinase family protein [Solirubrobacteraceae bacterium]
MRTIGHASQPGLMEQLEAGGEKGRRRILMIVNPYATTVSARLKNLISAALRSRYELDTIETERKGHATEICREAGGEGYDAIIAYGGDGTLNEAANGLVNSGTPLSCLPGGRANVYCRILGIPTDVIDATEQLLALDGAWHPYKVDMGRVGSRHFLFSAGVGLDADVVGHVDAHPLLKARLGEYYYAWVATSTFVSRYLFNPPRFRAEFQSADTAASATVAQGVTALVQNASPYTYFGDRRMEMAEHVTLTSGDLAGLILKRASPLDIASIGWRALSPRARVAGHRQIDPFSATPQLRIRSLDDRQLPFQVDGDYLGSAHELTFSAAPSALTVLA